MRRNPSTKVMANWFQGVDPMDVGIAAGSLVASTMVPGYLVKDVSTQGGKLWRLLASIGTAAACGLMFRNKPSTARAAVLGGLAGSATMAIGMYTSIDLGRAAGQLSRGNVRRMLPGPQGIRQTTAPEFKEVRMN